MSRYSISCMAALCCFFVSKSFSQNYSLSEARKIVPGADRVMVDEKRKSISFIELNAKEFVAASGSRQWLEASLKVQANEKYILYKAENDKQGYTHFRYRQHINNVAVEYGVFYVHTKEGRITSANGERYENISVNTVPTLNEQEAYKKATAYFNSSMLRNDDAIEKPVLMILPHENKYRLTYKIDLFSQHPLKREYIYVDAHDGSIVKTMSRIHDGDAVATGISLFNGPMITFTTDSASPTLFTLQEAARPVHTWNLQNGFNPPGVDFTDTDNSWTSTANNDHSANDAHYGAEATFDFFFNNFARNSYDNLGSTINSYVHYGTNVVNAFWTGTEMLYGDGDGVDYYPLTSMEIVGHEITHGVTEYSAGLIYSGESGALNESFSDLFGNTIRFITSPAYASWFIGDQIVMPGGSGSAFRNMADPNQFQCADTYGGLYFNNGDIVHYDSGIQNFWYYLLSSGGTGVNDNNDVYTVNAIGLMDAAAIAYRNLSVYLTPNSTFMDARNGAIQAAIDLYGSCSDEVIQTTNAWYAVGVGGLFSNAVVAGFNAPNTYYCVIPATVSFTNGSMNATAFSWDFGDGGTSTVANPTYTYNNAGVYTVTLIAGGTGSCSSTDTLIIPNYISVTNGGGPISASCSPNTISACCGIGIYNFQFGTINKNSPGASEGYKDFTCSNATTLVAGDPVPIHVGTGSTTNENVHAYIDYDNDGVFNSTNEFVFSSLNKLLNHNGIVYTPTTATLNTPIRMRVIDDNVTTAIASGCHTPQNGQVEDYTLTFLPNSLPPVADFVGAPLVVNVGNSVQFNDLTVNAPTSWQWNFPGGTPSSSTAQNPFITYNALGTYDAQLIVSNAFGTDTIDKIGYINVVSMSYMCTNSFTAALNGLLYDSGGPTGSYQNGENCNLLIKPPCADSITLTFTSFSTEQGWDFLKVYDGISTAAPQLLNISGSGIPLPVTATSGAMYVVFTSDAVINGAGFEASWSTVASPGTPPIPPTCTPATGMFCCNIAIANVAFNTINNSSTNTSSGYEDFSCSSQTTVTAGQSYSINVNTGNVYAANVRAWIDWDNDGAFAVSEQVFASNNVMSNHSGSISIPLTAVTGPPLRMRIASDHWALSVPTPCNSSQYGQFEDYGIFVVLPSAPVAAFSFLQSACTDTVTFADASTNSPTSWSWSFGDGSTSALQNPVHVYSSSGTYQVALIACNAGGCDTVFQNLNVTILTSAFSYSGVLIQGLPVSFTDLSTGNSIAAWLWNFGDGLVSSQQNPVHTYGAGGIFIVCLTVTDIAGCEKTSCDSVVISGVGIAEFAGTTGISVSPNPFSSETNITVELNEKQSVELHIYDITGRKTETFLYAAMLMPGKYKYIFSNGIPGIYFAELITEKGKAVVKMVRVE